MIRRGNSTLKDVSDLSETAKTSIMDFLQGTVYCWCKNRKGEWFTMSDLMGGDNRDWRKTPLEILYNKHIQSGKTAEEAFDNAGKESGWLLKKVVHDDKKDFETEETELSRKYRWLEDWRGD
jgi:hypothetical protein